MIIDVLTMTTVTGRTGTPAEYWGSIAVRFLWTDTHVQQASLHSGISHIRVTGGWWASNPARPSGYFDLR